ncbi:hypothetical protein DFJ74DRAFT_664723 [Hyaloraphidium curvatum]|nr:hypothetical protein DFJ74DRAFT_664723 [Hyaloraphidium curvatum]
MFRNADYVLQEITAITEGASSRSTVTDLSRRTTPLHSRAQTPVIRSAWQSSSPASQSPKREAERRPEPFSDLPSLADLQGSDPDDSVASIEGVFADAAKYEMTAQALEAQRDRLQEQLIEKDRQLELAESKLRAVYQAYCSLADWTNSLIGTGAAYDPASESEEQIGSAGSTAAPSSDVEASQADSALPTPLVAPIFPLAPVQPEAQDPPASKLVRKPSFPDLRAQAFPETQPARGLSIFGAAKLGKAADKPAFNFRSPLQLLGMEKRDDGDSPLSSLLEQFSFGKTAAPEAKKAKAVPPSPAHSTASVATVVSAPATEPVAAKPADMASVSPAKRPSDQENAPPALTIVGAADAAPAAAEDAFGERRRKKRQAPVLLDYAGGFDVAIASAVGAFDAYGSLVPPPRNSSRKPGTHSAAAAPEAVQEEQSAIILSSPSESFRPSSMDFREVVTISQPSNSPNPKPSELAPAPPRRPSAMRMQARLDMAPAVVTVATEVRDKVEPVLAPAPEISRVSLSPPPPEPVPAEPVAADDFPKEPPAPAKEATAPTPPAGPLMPSQVKAMEAAKAKQSDAKPAAKPKDPAAKRKRVVRKPAGRGAAIDLYAYSGTLSATSDESGNPAALVDQISMNFRDMKNL